VSATLDWCRADLGFATAVVADAGRGICLIGIGGERGEGALAAWRSRHAPGARLRACSGRPSPRLGAACRQLAEYGRGLRRAFELELDLRGTEFERAVWSGLLEVPFGEVTTYGQLARALGRPGAARAVGGAAGRNPVPVVVPCHRLLASGGLGGFTGGLEHKRALLALEGHAFEHQTEWA